jgi:hypothetical protein
VSYDIRLTEPDTGDTICFDEAHDHKGGTYAMGGTNEAWLNITYNYSPFYRQHVDNEQGIRWLYGKTGAEVLPRLRAAVAKLGTEQWTGTFLGLNWPTSHYEKWGPRLRGVDLEAPENAGLRNEALAAGVVKDCGGYWKPTPGNAGHALLGLIAFAEARPDGVFQGD